MKYRDCKNLDLDLDQLKKIDCRLYSILFPL